MNNSALQLLKDLAITLGGAVALITLWVALIQYAGQRRQDRAKQFIEMRRRFLEDATFRHLLNMLAEGHVEISKTSKQDRRNLVGFLEEIGLMMNSNLIKPRVAHYMFGYYVLLIDSSELFWDGLDKDSEYWEVFRAFAKEMRAIEVLSKPQTGPIRI
jgi:hypothetical protein